MYSIFSFSDHGSAQIVVRLRSSSSSSNILQEIFLFISPYSPNSTSLPNLLAPNSQIYSLNIVHCSSNAKNPPYQSKDSANEWNSWEWSAQNSFFLLTNFVLF